MLFATVPLRDTIQCRPSLPSMQWKVNLAVVFGSPIIGADGTIFVSDLFTGTYALNGATGELRWSIPPPATCSMEATPALASN